MNNHRLLTGLLAFTLSSGAMCSAQSTFTLEDIFAIAESNSSQLRPAFSAIDESDKEISVARSNRLPDIKASVSVGYLGDGFTTARDFGDYHKAENPHLNNSASITIEQPLYSGGAISAGLDLAELKSSASRYAADFQRDNIRFRLTGYYLDIYKYTNLRSVILSNIESARTVLDDMKARHEQGTVLQNDITRYELLLSTFELQLVRIDNTLNILNKNLVTEAGLPFGTVVVPDSTILSRSLPTEQESWWQSEAEGNAPVLSLARTNLDISRKAEKLAKADRLPKVGIQAGWLLEGPIVIEVPPINRNLSYWYVGLGVSYNISSLYKTNKSVSRSRAATHTAALQLDAERERVELNIHSDHVRYLEAYEELKTQQKSVELAQRNYNVTETRYGSDMALITDMLDAATARLDAQQQLVNARINIIYYYYKLLFTTGKI